jgi:hypothetical protein
MSYTFPATGYSVKDGRETYRVLDAFLNAGRDKSYRKIANNTYLDRWPDDGIGVTLHATRIVTVYPDGTIELRFGGWHTVTTNDRMNALMPRGVRVSGHYPALLYIGGWDGAAYDVTRGGVIRIGPRGGVQIDGKRIAPSTETAIRAPYKAEAARMRREARRERERWQREQHAAEIARQEYAAWAEAHPYEAAVNDLQDEAEYEDAAREREAQIERERIAREQQAAAWREALPVASKDEPLRLWKYLEVDTDGTIYSHYDGSPWTVGDWRDDRVVARCVGLNASGTRAEAHRYVAGAILALVEAAGRYHDGGDKVTCDSMRIVCAWRAERVPLSLTASEVYAVTPDYGTVPSLGNGEE